MKDFSDAPSTRKTLLLRIRNPANTEAWQTFVDLYSPLIYHFCLRRGLQEADCRDVLQNVLLSVHRQILSFQYDPERGRFRNWLITIVLRQISRYQSRMDKGTRGAGGGLGDQLADQMGKDEEQSWNDNFQHRVLELAIERLRGEFSPEVFQAFEAVWYYEKKPGEVAQAMGQSPPWVYEAKYRVLKRLKQEVEFLGGILLSPLTE
jgi:RNA polymerase sigma factor (sigma-70 family)